MCEKIYIGVCQCYYCVFIKRYNMSHWPLAFKRGIAAEIHNIGELKRVAGGNITFGDKRDYPISAMSSDDGS